MFLVQYSNYISSWRTNDCSLWKVKILVQDISFLQQINYSTAVRERDLMFV